MTDGMPPDWGEAVEAYNLMAHRYDDLLVENRINRYMRRLSVAHLLAAFGSGDYVLELGCGTGDEAIELASRGVRVIALDPAEEALRRAREKAEERALGDRLTFIRGKARDLHKSRMRSLGPFNGGYASFSLAYEPDLAAVAPALGALLRPDAVFLASLPSQFCLVEFLISLVAARPYYAGRRLKPWYEHKVGDTYVPIRTYTPKSLAGVMAPHFALSHVEGLPALVPPSYMNRWYARLSRFADVLERLDGAVRTRFPFKYLGDHFLAELRRTRE